MSNCFVASIDSIFLDILSCLGLRSVQSVSKVFSTVLVVVIDYFDESYMYCCLIQVYREGKTNPFLGGEVWMFPPVSVGALRMPFHHLIDVFMLPPQLLGADVSGKLTIGYLGGDLHCKILWWFLLIPIFR